MLNETSSIIFKYSAFLTLISSGKGIDGCLGHGSLDSIKKPKIVEILLGEEIVKVALSEKHILALTSTGDLYSWGRNLGGCLGLGR